MATSCSDNSVCVWDVRKLSQGGKPVSSISHSLTCQSAYFAPDGVLSHPLHIAAIQLLLWQSWLPPSMHLHTLYCCLCCYANAVGFWQQESSACNSAFVHLSA